ncbi:RrF2 family transcriptional regulator [Enterovirga aerilata]|uniref:Rrf2 family transcriptional regulator n=1 Tax=Enterovirga aerilata TaxID=2730920 RepID=A0A849I5D0_9HYPH|nr:Rrf2 family transcriptional regulator [Enterovirga sp. DB1703]NNM74662.1 Rrf2 family transcriptional regulator [Enterovirga sp. DB1703]
MNLLSRRSLFAIAAVVDVALHARPVPVTAKALAARHNLPPRHLETVLQALVRNGILKGLRGPRGGYELARERRRVTVGDIVRAAQGGPEMRDEEGAPEPRSPLVEEVVAPAVAAAGEVFLRELDGITVEDLCRRVDKTGGSDHPVDFTI